MVLYQGGASEFNDLNRASSPHPGIVFHILYSKGVCRLASALLTRGKTVVCGGGDEHSLSPFCSLHVPLGLERLFVCCLACVSVPFSREIKEVGEKEKKKGEEKLNEEDT